MKILFAFFVPIIVVGWVIFFLEMGSGGTLPAPLAFTLAIGVPIGFMLAIMTYFL